jgi:hypothetical protein
MFIQELADNVSIDEVFALEGMELIPFREKPGKFLRIRLADRTGEIYAIVWDDAEDVRERLAQSVFVNVSGITHIYRDKLSITVNVISPVGEGMIDSNDFLPCTPKNRRSLLAEIRSMAKKQIIR